MKNSTVSSANSNNSAMSAHQIELESESIINLVNKLVNSIENRLKGKKKNLCFS